MSALIAEPGIYAGIPAEAYHGASLTPTFALSSTGARKIASKCPLAFWWDSPLNPAFEPEVKEAFDIGTATHYLVLEPAEFDRKVQEIDAPDWKKDAPKEQAKEARAAGKLPLLTKQVREVRQMRNAVFAHPIAGLAFQGGEVEQTIAWVDAETGVWLRCRPDFLPSHGRYMVDVKTAASAHPREFEKAVWNHGYYCQAAWYVDAVEAATGERPAKFFFVSVEKTAPFLVAVHEMDPDAIAWGRIQNRRSIRTFAECMASGKWPGYRDALEPHKDQAFKIGLPGWATRDLEARHERGEFADNAFQRAADAQAPLQQKDAAE